MTAFQIEITLLSETIFGRGDGRAGVVDLEIQHDSIGCPYWSGRAVKGILVNECADILAALGGRNAPAAWQSAAGALFGRPGSSLDSEGCLSISEAHLPDDLRHFLAWQLEKRIESILYDGMTDIEKRSAEDQQREMFRKQLLQTLTTTRSQTALEEDGSAKEHSLRTNRTVLRDLVFISDIQSSRPLEPLEKGLLAACVMAMRAGGSGRNRGKGSIQARIMVTGEDETLEWFRAFKGGL